MCLNTALSECMRPNTPLNSLGRGRLRVGYLMLHSCCMAVDVEPHQGDVSTTRNDQGPLPRVARAPPLISPLCWRNRLFKFTVYPL